MYITRFLKTAVFIKYKLMRAFHTSGFLKEHGILATVLSNKPHQRALENVAHVFGDHTFDKVYGEREALGIRKKPAP